MVALDRPVLDSYFPTDNRGGKIKLERNPYFHQVDPKGNQLPYIDRIEVSHTGDQDLYALKITAGEIDFGARFTRTSDMQLYKEKEASGNYKTYMAKSLRPSEKSVFINHNYPDKEYNNLFNNLNFRIALSQSINRQQINDVLFFGLAEVHPPTPLKTIPWYKKEWENEY
jgi:peptide/nickel transport system substrate-binding protein